MIRTKLEDSGRGLKSLSPHRRNNGSWEEGKGGGGGEEKRLRL